MKGIRQMAVQHRAGIFIAAVLSAGIALTLSKTGLPSLPGQTWLQSGSAVPSYRDTPDSLPTAPGHRESAELAGTRGFLGFPDVVIPRAGISISGDLCESEAHRVAEQLLAQYPNTAEALHVLALLSAQMRRTSDAEDYWRRAAAATSNNVQYLINIAVLATERGDFETATETLRAVIGEHQHNFNVRFNYGLALLRGGDVEAAEQLLLDTVRLFPESGASWATLAEAQLDAGDSAAAIDSYQRARQLGVDSAELFFQLAEAARREGNVDLEAESMDAFNARQSDTEVEPTSRFLLLSDAEARATLITTLIESASVYAENRDSTRAEMLLLRALAIDPMHIAVCATLADFYESLGDLANEHVVRRHLATLDPLRLNNSLRLASSLAAVGNSAEAEATLKLALSHQPGSAVLSAALAEFLAEQGRHAKALAYAEEATRIAPSHAGYRFVANLHRALGNEPAALAALSASVEALESGGTASAAP